MVSARTSRLEWLDALRVAAGLSMVGLHATSDSQGQPWVAYDVGERVAPLLLRTLLYVARTELFIIIAIFLIMLNLEKVNYRRSARKYWDNLAIPYLFWSLAFLVITSAKAMHFGYLSSYSEGLLSLSRWSRIIFLGEAKYHLHFLPTLIPLLLAYPLYTIAKRHPWWALIAFPLLLIKSEIDPIIWREFAGTDALPWIVRGVKLVSYLGYGFCAAALAWAWETRTPLKLAWLFRAAACVLFLMVLGKFWVAKATIETGAWQYNSTLGFWVDYLAPLVLFALIMGLNFAGNRALKIVGRFSFGIYLTHPLFLDIIEIALRDTSMPPIWIVMCKIGFVFPATLAFVILLSRHPTTSWTLGLKPSNKRVKDHQHAPS